VKSAFTLDALCNGSTFISPARGNNEMKKSAGECFRAADNQRKSISDISQNGRAGSKTFIPTRGRVF
jgi:hypothetical protein